MKSFFILVFLLGFSILLVNTASPKTYLERYLKEIDQGQKCRVGFITLSQRVREAALRCSKEKHIASYLCFVICVAREHEYIVPGHHDELDLGLADLIAMESSDLTTKEARDAYIHLAIQQYNCAVKHVLRGKKVTFPFDYDDAGDCKSGHPFFSCVWKTLTCGKYDIA